MQTRATATKVKHQQTNEIWDNWLEVELLMKNVKTSFFGSRQQEWTETEIVTIWGNKEYFYRVAAKDTWLFNGNFFHIVVRDICYM